MLSEMDAVSLHCPKNNETTDMFSDKEFNIMKDSSYLINCATGGIVNEKALYNALTSNKIRGAGLDVYDDEPSTSSNPLFGLNNVLLSPHIAGVTQDITLHSVKMWAHIPKSGDKRALESPTPFNFFDAFLRSTASTQLRVTKTLRAKSE